MRLPVSTTSPKTQTAARSYRIGLLGSYGSNNLGDTSVQKSVMQNLRRWIPGASFFGFAWSAADVARTHRIPSIIALGEGPFVIPQSSGPDIQAPIPHSRWVRAFLAVLPAMVRRTIIIGLVTYQLDALFISGSAQIDDYWGGAFVQPWRLMIWSLWSKLHGIPVVVMGVGFGELHTRMGKTLAVNALRLTDFRFFRDPGTVTCLQKLGFHEPSVLGPDPAFGLVFRPEPPAYNHRPFVVINPIARQAWPGDEDEDYRHYLDCLAALGSHFLERGVEVHFACSQILMDPPIVEEVLRRMPPENARHCEVVAIQSVEDYCRATAHADLVISTRLHGLILAAVAGTPIFAIANTRKVRQLMVDLDMSSQYRDIHALRRDDLMTAVNSAYENRLALKSALAAKINGYRAALEAINAAVVSELARHPLRLKADWLGLPGGMPAPIPSVTALAPLSV